MNETQEDFPVSLPESTETPNELSQTDAVATETVAQSAAENVEGTQAEVTPEVPAKPKAAKLQFDDIDSVIKALADQDEVLKSMKQQVQDMIAVNAALRKGIKQIVQEASKTDELTAELAATKKKLQTVKQFLGA
jgi:hypothetical protein